jgi:uncharacterized membrane protein SpoIIM required for sporulation/uncharacterized RDD family membrane protein YckC
MDGPPQKSLVETRTTRGLEQVVDIETPEQVVFSYTVAGVGSRAAAALIDHAILFGALLALALLVFLVAPGFGIDARGNVAQHTAGWMVAILFVIQFLAQWGYYVLFEGLWDGQTPGKRWLGLRVVQDGGYSVSFAASAARNIARIVDMQPFITYLVGLVTVAFSKSGKRAGDQLAGTLVVRERILSVPVAAAATGAGELSGALTAALTEDELELLQRFLSRADTLDERRRSALAAQLAQQFRAHLQADRLPLQALRTLLQREQDARARGVGARGETGAARERYALIAEGAGRWSRFATRLAAVQRTGLSKMSSEDVAEFVADYREIATDLARLSTATRGRTTDEVFRVSRLVAGGHNVLYRQERVAAQAIARFLFQAVPAELRRSILLILAAALLFFGSGIASFVAVVRDPAIAEELVPPGMMDRAEVDAARARAGDRRYIDVEDYSRPILASEVFRNNVQVTFLAFASGLTAGVFTVILLLLNGILLGSVLGFFVVSGAGPLIFDFVIAHGTFELTAICIAAAAGFRIAGALLVPGARTRREALVVEGRRALHLLTAAALFLVFAGAIEGLISPRIDLGFAFKASVSAVSALIIVFYALLGSNEPTATPSP